MSDNRNLAQITTLKEALEAWDIYFSRFFSNKIPGKLKIVFDPSIREFKPRENKEAKNFPPFKDGQIFLEGRTDHSDDFDDFLNGCTITIPESIELNHEKLNLVKIAIKKGNFSSDIFKNLDHIYYSLWLFKLNKITREQMGTILAMWQVGKKEGFRILDSSGNFTNEAKNILLPVLKETSFTGRLTKAQIERFRLLVMASPKSEQIFYLSDPIPDLLVKDGEKQLGFALQRLNSWYQLEFLNGSTKDLHLSLGTIEALQIAIRGPQGAAAARPIIGKVGINAVKEAVEYNSRPTAVSVPESGVDATTKQIHGYAESPMPAVTAHDTFHTKLHNTIPPEFHLMLNHMGEIISKHTKQQWSKLLWELVDREFYVFRFFNIELSTKNGSEYFAKMFHNTKQTNQIFPLRNNEITDEGIAIILHMVKNKEVWKNLYKVDIDNFSDPYKSYINKMQRFVGMINADCPSELFNFKFRLYCLASNDKEYQYMNNLINDNELNFKYNKIKNGRYKNHTILTLDNDGNNLEVNNQNIKTILSKSVKQKFANDQEIDPSVIETQLGTMLPHFTRITENTSNKDLSDLLNTSLENLPTLEEKLLFLEKCNKKILSLEYHHEYPTLDRLFSFIKTPLTNSQKTHQEQVGKKIIEVIKEFSKDMSAKEKEEFQWRLKNRDPKFSTYSNILKNQPPISPHSYSYKR